MADHHERVAAIERQRYYANLFLPLVGRTVLYELGTLGDRYRLEQRELCTSLGSRQSVYTTLQQVVDAVGRRNQLAGSATFPIALQMGCVYPMRPSPVAAQRARVDMVRRETLANHGFVPRHLAGGDWDEDVLKPRQHERGLLRTGFASPQGELVIDVDLDAELHYPRPPSVCACGTAKRVCDTCWWLYMDPAMAALDWVLRDFYGFRAMFTVFSGRRGFHTWILDERVHKWTAAERGRFAESLAPPKAVPPPALRDDLVNGVLAVLEPMYEERRHLLDPIAGGGGANTPKGVFALWPRIDHAVTADATHLHKLPLSAHPETGNVCVITAQGRYADAVAAGEHFIPSRDCVHARDATRNMLVACEQVIKRAIEEISP